MRSCLWSTLPAASPHQQPHRPHPSTCSGAVPTALLTRWAEKTFKAQGAPVTISRRSAHARMTPIISSLRLAGAPEECMPLACRVVDKSAPRLVRGQKGVICFHESTSDSTGLCRDNNTCSCSYLPPLHSHTQHIFKSKNFSLLYSPCLTDTNTKYITN